MKRRNFLKTSTRWGLVGILVAGSALLIRRPDAEADCHVPQTCQSCGRLETCQEPQADKARHEHEHAEDDHGRE